MDSFTGTGKQISGFQSVKELLPNWKKDFPKNVVTADFKKFKYGSDQDFHKLIHPLLGATTVKKVKEIELLGGIKAVSTRQGWIWFITTDEIPASDDAPGKQAYKKGDKIRVVSKAWVSYKESLRTEEERMARREFAKKMEQEANESLVQSEISIQDLDF